MMVKIENLILDLNKTKPYTRTNIGQNKWIVKPSAGSKGKNIKIFQDINDITSQVYQENKNSTTGVDLNFIVQK